MNRIARVPVLAAAALSLMLCSAGCKRLEARDQLNKGVQAYKAAKYEEAIGHFQRAVNLDPTYPMTRIYLATAYMQQVVPDLTTPENLKNAKLAIDSYQQVLQEHPNDINSLKGIASLYMSMDKFDEAKQWQMKVLSVDPQNAEAAYTIGVIDWRLAYKNAVSLLKGAGLQDGGDGNPKAPKGLCQSIQQQNTAVVAEGLKFLNMAVQVRPTYDDAMSYLNLMYRRQADLECGNDAARKSDLAQADTWREKAMGTRKSNEEKKAAAASGGIVMDQTK
ncbi:MAG TPA: tetratricopeptide repeat protein [Acidobacteriaceae bacterium]